MHRWIITVVATAVAVVLVMPSAAADEDEVRVGIGAVASVVSLEAFATSDSTDAYGGTFSVARGLRNWLDVGADVTYLARPNATLGGATVDELGGAGFELYANLHDVKLAAHTRFILEGGPLYRVRPVLDVGAGLGLRLLTSPELFGPNGARARGTDTDLSLAPFVGASAGLTWRFFEALQVGVLGTISVATNEEIYGLHLELSRFSYDWL